MLNLVQADTAAPTVEDFAERAVKLFTAAHDEGLALDDADGTRAALLKAIVQRDGTQCATLLDDLDQQIAAARIEHKLDEQRNEIAALRARFNAALHNVRLGYTNGDVAGATKQFEAFAADGDVAACREMAERFERVIEAKKRPQWQIEDERREGAAKARKAFAEAQAREAAERHRREVLERYSYGRAFIEADKRGTLSLGPNEEIVYSGAALDADLVMALQADAQNVRITLRQRWRDRVIVPAPEAA